MNLNYEPASEPLHVSLRVVSRKSSTTADFSLCRREVIVGPAHLEGRVEQGDTCEGGLGQIGGLGLL